MSSFSSFFKLPLLGFLFGLFCFSLYAQNNLPSPSILNSQIILFEKANQLYKDSKFEESLIYYDSLINKMNLQSASLYYNNANAHYRTGNIGLSVLNYEKALLLAPHHKPSIENLAFIQSSFKNLNNPQSFSIWSPFHNFILSISLNFKLYLLSFCVALFFIIFSITLWLQSSSLRKKIVLYNVLFTFIFIFTLILSLFYHIYQTESGSYAICINSSCPLYSAPGIQNKTTFKINEGDKFKVLLIEDNWAKVELANRSTGFIEQQKLKLIQLKPLPLF